MKKLLTMALAAIMVVPALVAPSVNAIGSTGPRFQGSVDGWFYETDQDDDDCNESLWNDCEGGAGEAEGESEAEAAARQELEEMQREALTALQDRRARAVRTCYDRYYGTLDNANTAMFNLCVSRETWGN